MYRTHLLRDNVEARARLVAARTPSAPSQRSLYILGCGRSGTTLLGSIMEWHPEVTYFFEPQNRWAMVDRRTDVWKRYVPWVEGALLTAGDASAAAAARRSRLFRVGTPVMVDKSPEHAFRLGFLDGIDPGAQFLHIVRDGTDVAKSIDQMARNDHPVLGRHRYNEWWGMDDAKWEFLLRVADLRGYETTSVRAAAGNAERGLCEWLLSLEEVERHRSLLGDRLLEIHYLDLVTDPVAVLTLVRDFAGLGHDPAWLDRGAAEVRAPTPKPPTVVTDDARLLEELDRARVRHGLR